MIELLSNFVAGEWRNGVGHGTTLLDPVLGTGLVRVDATGLDLPEAFDFARRQGAQALRELSYRKRAAALAACAKVLQANRPRYFDIATANSGTVRNDSAVDIDGAIYTLGQYAKWGDALGDADYLIDGASSRLDKGGTFLSQHIQVPTPGLALLINAFNFPAWGLWEKAAPALLSGVPVLVKPATATAWLAQQMVRDIVEAGVLPLGALSIVCGSSKGLMDAVRPFDVVSFTGSADTAAVIRSHPAVTQGSTRVNIEADSLNSALLLPGATVGDFAFDALVSEVVREMTVKSGQKCTAIRRVFVPESLYYEAADAIRSRLATVKVGNPRNDSVRMGSLASRVQLANVRQGIQSLREQVGVLYDGSDIALLDADPSIAACVGPVLFGVDANANDIASIHEIEVFGPVATLIAYRNLDQGLDLVRRGGGSLVVSLYDAEKSPALVSSTLKLAATHGRVHMVTPSAASTQTGHGNVMPQSLHGGPGRAGGGEELGGTRALNFYHRRVALQADEAVVSCSFVGAKTQ